MRKSLNKFSSIACNSTIAPNKQGLEHNNLATVRRAKLKGAYVFQEPPICENLDQMQTHTKCKPLQEWTG